MEYEMVKIEGAYVKNILTPKEQRRLRRKKVLGVIAAAKSGLIIPPILICRHGGKSYITDGQHRLEAWREYNYPLYALIASTTPRNAVKSFLCANMMASKLTSQHAYTVSPHKTSWRLRHIAKSAKTDVADVAKVVIGLTKRSTLAHDAYTNGSLPKAAAIVGAWCCGPRWEKRLGIYAERGTLQAVGRVCSDVKDVVATVERIKKIDFSSGSPASRFRGTQFYNVDGLANFMRKKILSESL